MRQDPQITQRRLWCIIVRVTEQLLSLITSEPMNIESSWTAVITAKEHQESLHKMIQAYESKPGEVGSVAMSRHLLTACQYALDWCVYQKGGKSSGEEVLTTKWNTNSATLNIPVHLAQHPDPSIVSSKIVSSQSQQWHRKNVLQQLVEDNMTFLKGCSMAMYWGQFAQQSDAQWAVYVSVKIPEIGDENK